MFMKSNVKLANKQSVFLLMILPFGPVRQFKAENTTKIQEKN